jgi:8-oxo-dGTP diphosphatase
MIEQAQKYEYDYPRPCITCDCIVTYGHKILLVRRKNDPFKGMLALPGGFFDTEKDESVRLAAERELEEETGIDENLSFYNYYDAIGRDPRQRTVTFVFSKNYDTRFEKVPVIKAGDDAAKVEWFYIENLWFENLAFDHKQILKDYFNVKVKR